MYVFTHAQSTVAWSCMWLLGCAGASWRVGALDQGEVREMMATLGKELTDAEFAVIMDKIDEVRTLRAGLIGHIY